MQIRALKLQDVDYGNQWDDEIEDRWEYDDFRADSAWREGWISMDSVYHNADDDRVYLGITSFNADIFRAYDRATGEFEDLGYGKGGRSVRCQVSQVAGEVGERRLSVRRNRAPARYRPVLGGARRGHRQIRPGDRRNQESRDSHAAYVHPVDLPGPGARRDLRHDVHAGTPVPVQPRGRPLGRPGPISSGMEMAQGENVELDDDGCVWCGWSVTRAWQNFAGVDRNRLCKFDPETDRIAYFDRGLPSRTAATDTSVWRVFSTWVGAECTPAARTGRYTGSIRRPGWAPTSARPLRTAAAG